MFRIAKLTHGVHGSSVFLSFFLRKITREINIKNTITPKFDFKP